METSKDGKRRKDYNHEEERRQEIRPKRARSRSRSPAEYRERNSRRSKRRSSRSRSPNVPLKQEKQTNSGKDPEVKKDVPARRAKDTDMLNTRTGGAYIPPARLRMMQAQITDKSSVAYQRLAWEALKKSIHGHINKINVGNIGIIIKELLKENIIRGRGLLCRSVIQAQAASPTFTNVYAALVAAVNSRFPNIGELLLKRLVIQFKRGFKRNDKPICISSASFIAHLVNQRVAHEILALELLTLLVETPTDDSVEVSIAFLKECGQKLTEVSSKGVNAIFEMLRNILHEGQLDKRVQYMIEVMFQVWKDGFKDHPALIEELELVPEEDQFTHLMMLDEATDPQDILNVFKFDDQYEDNEQKYKTLSKEILGSDAESGEEDGSGESGSDEEDDDEEEQKEVTIIDNTETNLVALRRTIYLTINSSLDFEECAHKLMKMQLKPGQEVELCHMFLDCCAEQRTYEKFYGLLAQRFCNINRIYIGPFEEIFKDSYATAHRLDTNRLRNVSKFFAHLLFTDSISWEVLECVRLNEEDTTSSSRIYIKILFQELAEYMGLKKLNDRLKDPTLQDAFSGLFPRDNPKNTRFSINFFTSIGLGGLTDELREHLKQMPKNVPPLMTEIKLGSETSSDSSSDSSSSSSSSDSSSSDDEGDKSKKKKTKSKKNKEKETETLAEQVANDKNDRWDHDGFYDTYGKDAKRLESRTDRDSENFAKHWDRRNNQRNGDDRRPRRNDDDDRRPTRNKDDDRRPRRNEDDDRRPRRNEDDEFRPDRSRDDFREPRENRSQRDEGKSRYDDRQSEKELLQKDDDRNRRNREKNDDRSRRDDDRNRRDDDRSRRDDDSMRNNDRMREEQREDVRSYRENEKNRDDDDRIRKGDEKDRSRRNESKQYRDKERDDREARNERGHKEDYRGRRVDDMREDDRPRKGDDRDARRAEGSRRLNDRNGVDEGHKDRDEDKTRRANEKDYRDDRGVKGDDKTRNVDRNRKPDDRLQRGEEKYHRDDSRTQREDLEDSRSKKKASEEKSDRRKDNKPRYDQDENDSRSKRKNYVSDKYGDQTKELTERKSKKIGKEHKNKSKKDKKKKKQVYSDDEEVEKGKEHNDRHSKKKNKKKKEDIETDSDSSDSSSSSSSSSVDDTVGPNRYWDKFDIMTLDNVSDKKLIRPDKVQGRRTRS